MSLTTRGRGVVAIAVVSFVLALLFGARSLNAVVVPAAVLLLAAYVQVSRLPALSVSREPPGDAHVGEERVVELSFTDRDGEPLKRPFVGTVTERVNEGLRLCPPGEGESAYTVQQGEEVEEARFETAVGNEPLRYRLRYERRGEHQLGQASVRATDVFGLMETEFRLRGTSSVLVYPQVHYLHSWGRDSLRRLREYGRSEQREQFEELREYHPGDPLRDIHWKTTAKRDELVVKEFAAEAEAEAVTLAAGAGVDGADWMAEATASVALSLVDEGIPVEVTLPRGELTVGPDHGGERSLLRTLATATAGRVTDPEADITVTGRAEDAIVQVADAEYAFTELIDGRTERMETGRTEEVYA
ncbi:DUF58 domain-containing protein [Halolamina sp.]|uniref:DUF58 domain-containing protein n=1 Tax=Halolamina sp. TaxID=1940283 RepID=UPI0035651634